MEHQVFGETSELKQDSIYLYSNAFSFDIMKVLGNDDRFLDINQADVINLSLGMLMLCIMQFNNPTMSGLFLRVLNDREEFNLFLMKMINEGRNENKKLIEEIEGED